MECLNSFCQSQMWHPALSSYFILYFYEWIDEANKTEFLSKHFELINFLKVFRFNSYIQKLLNENFQTFLKKYKI